MRDTTIFLQGWNKNLIRLLITLGVITAMVLQVTAPTRTTADTASKPNIVFIMTDDQTVADMQWMQDTAARIGGNGVTYETSWTSLSWCCPSRATMKTGQHAHNHGVFGNSLPAGGFNKFEHQTALPVWMQNAGYETVHIGKAMNDTKANIPDGWDDWRSTLRGDHKMYNWYLNDNGTRRFFGKGDANYQGDVYAQMAADVIADSDDTQPFFMHYTISAPHVGVGKVPEPPSRYKNTVDAPLPRPEGFSVPSGMTLSELQKEYRRRAESLMGADDQVEKILDALEDKGIRENTVVIFTSDNGYLMGEHGLRGKSNYYQEAMAVPLMISGPGFASGVVETAPVQNIDLAPTIAALAGAQPLIEVDGVSLLGNLDENRGLLFESKRDDPNVPIWSGIRTDRFVYVDGANRGFLWDMAVDPTQITNFYDDPGYGQLRNTLQQQLDNVRNCAGADCHFVIDNDALNSLVGEPADPGDQDGGDGGDSGDGTGGDGGDDGSGGYGGDSGDGGDGGDSGDGGDGSGDNTDSETLTFPARNNKQTTLYLSTNGDTINASWDEVVGATRYQLNYKKPGSKRVWVPVTTDTNVTLSGLAAGEYEVQIRIYKAKLWQSWNIGQIEVLGS